MVAGIPAANKHSTCIHVDRGSLSTDHELASQTHHQMPMFRLLGRSLLQGRNSTCNEDEVHMPGLVLDHAVLGLQRLWIASNPGFPPKYFSQECGRKA